MTSQRTTTRGRSKWSTSERWGSAFALGFLLSIAGEAIRWLTGTDESDAPWPVIRPAIGALIVAGALGWLITRGLEMRRGARAGLLETARPWVAPLLGILAIGVVYWAITALLTS